MVYIYIKDDLIIKAKKNLRIEKGLFTTYVYTLVIPVKKRSNVVTLSKKKSQHLWQLFIDIVLFF